METGLGDWWAIAMIILGAVFTVLFGFFISLVDSLKRYLEKRWFGKD